MKLSGTYWLKAPKEKVWPALNDIGILGQAIPGCKEIKPGVVSGGGETSSYEIVMIAGVGSVKGTYKGTIEISDTIPGSQRKLSLNASGNTGFVRAEGLVRIEAAEGETVIDYSGEAQIGGSIAGVGQRMIDGAAKLLLSQFFKSFEAAVKHSDK
jgi:carbon monoxide dehydrogenase subunit G